MEEEPDLGLLSWDTRTICGIKATYGCVGRGRNPTCSFLLPTA